MLYSFIQQHPTNNLALLHTCQLYLRALYSSQFNSYINIQDMLKIYSLVMLLAVICLHARQAPKSILQLLDQLSLSTWKALRDKASNSIVSVGGTGVGKSTSINLLAGHTLNVVNSSDKVYQRYQSPEGETLATKIGHTLSSQTSMPIHVASLINKDIQFYDTAGKQDTRSFFNAVVNYYGYETLFQNAHRVKLLIFIDELGLKQDKLQKTLFQLNLANNFTDNVGIVITKVKPTDKGNEEQVIRQYLYNQTEDAVRRGVKGAEIVKCAYVLNNVAFFSSPERLAVLNRTLDQERALIQEMIDRLEFAQPAQIKRFMNIENNYILQEKIIETEKLLRSEILAKLYSSNSSKTEEIMKDFKDDLPSAQMDLKNIQQLMKNTLGQPADNYVPFWRYLIQKIKATKSRK